MGKLIDITGQVFTRVQRISVTQDGERVRAEAIALLGGEPQTIATEETAQSGETFAMAEARAIAELRKTLYAAGVPKRAIAAAVKRHRERSTS
jgi:hypothetical protein